MRFRGIHHVELSVPDYEKSVNFYDQMFGWLGYKSFWTLDIGYRSTYYVARFPFAHSYIGIQPAHTSEKLNYNNHATGIHHVALWARNRKEVDRFYKEFLIPKKVVVTDSPTSYPIYAPGYYAVFFLDTNGIRWELACTPFIPTPLQILETLKAAKALHQQHPEWKHSVLREMWRKLPSQQDPHRKHHSS